MIFSKGRLTILENVNVYTAEQNLVQIRQIAVYYGSLEQLSSSNQLELVRAASD